MAQVKFPVGKVNVEAPSIGANGNWFIKGKDTGVNASAGNLPSGSGFESVVLNQTEDATYYEVTNKDVLFIKTSGAVIPITKVGVKINYKANDDSDKTASAQFEYGNSDIIDNLTLNIKANYKLVRLYPFADSTGLYLQFVINGNASSSYRFLITTAITDANIKEFGVCEVEIHTADTYPLLITKVTKTFEVFLSQYSNTIVHHASTSDFADRAGEADNADVAEMAKGLMTTIRVNKTIDHNGVYAVKLKAKDDNYSTVFIAIDDWMLERHSCFVSTASGFSHNVGADLNNHSHSVCVRYCKSGGGDPVLEVGIMKANLYGECEWVTSLFDKYTIEQVKYLGF